MPKRYIKLYLKNHIKENGNIFLGKDINVWNVTGSILLYFLLYVYMSYTRTYIPFMLNVCRYINLEGTSEYIMFCNQWIQDFPLHSYYLHFTDFNLIPWQTSNSLQQQITYLLNDTKIVAFNRHLISQAVRGERFSKQWKDTNIHMIQFWQSCNNKIDNCRFLSW